MSVNRSLACSTTMLALLAGGAVLMPGTASAATVTVPAGATVAQQVVADGDTLEVEAGALVQDAGDAVVDVTNLGTIGVVNHGIIESTAAGGISATQSTLYLTNTGIISGATFTVGATTIPVLTNSGMIGFGQVGVTAVSLGMLENSGMIDGAVHGIATFDALGTVINSGSITGGTGSGVGTDGTITSLVNSGYIAGAMAGVRASGGDILSLTNSGQIISDAYGVFTGGTLQQLANSGLISGNDAIDANAIGTIHNAGDIVGLDTGIRSDGNIDVLTNSGHIGGPNYGVRATGDILVLDNSGSIAGDTGVIAVSISSLGNSGSIEGSTWGVFADHIGNLDNSGQITAEVGVRALTANMTNSGTIHGSTIWGIYGGELTLTNSGTVSSVGKAVHSDTVQSLTNSGTISGFTGVFATQGIVSLTNSGTIRGADPSNSAIWEAPANGVDTRLTLNSGSVIIGQVQISSGNDTLNVGDGLNLALTFESSVPELIETNGNPFVVIGNTVHVVDAAALQAATDLTAGLAGGIGGAVSTGLRQGFDELGANGETNVWLEGFGAAGQGAAGRSLLGGAAAGADFGPDADHRLGAFAGAGRGIMAATANSAQLNSLYAGIYGLAQLEDFEVEGIFAAGVIETDHSRTVANNTVATGLETATGTETAWFLAPQVTLRKGFVTADTMWDASLTVGYTGVFSAGYTEIGTASPLSVGAGASHVLDAKALLSLPYENTQMAGGVLTADVHAGVTGTAVIASAANGTLSGTALALMPGSAVKAGLTGGAALDYEFSPGATLYGGIDGGISFDLAIGVSAEAGLKGTF